MMRLMFDPKFTELVNNYFNRPNTSNWSRLFLCRKYVSVSVTKSCLREPLCSSEGQLKIGLDVESESYESESEEHK